MRSSLTTSITSFGRRCPGCCGKEPQGIQKSSSPFTGRCVAGESREDSVCAKRRTRSRDLLPSPSTEDGKVVVRFLLTCAQEFVVSQEEHESQGHEELVRRAYHSIFTELKSVSERGVHASRPA